MARTTQLFAQSKTDVKMIPMYSENQIAADYASVHSRVLNPLNVQNIRIVLVKRQPGLY